MNIRQAKEYIKEAVRLYLKKDEYGQYRVPLVRQRPIFLLGAPGIGKTAILEQIAQEMEIALVTYSMTHHTRQSALGLPFIVEKNYGGKAVSVSEYTMSEIIASIYDTMEASGKKEGILFLDEINCVSETLAPSMLQFLQYKTFGRHAVPEGWVIVTAGNPPEYNRSVREFDVVTMDRLRVLEVEPDLRVWKQYAAEKRLHSAVLSYLELKKEQFYCMELTAGGRSYVTARGWEDLSEMLLLYEEEQLAVEEALIGQYVRNQRIAKEFAAYYDLYRKYKRDYRIEDILNGSASPQAVERARTAAFDERLSLLGMLLDKVQADMELCREQADFLKDAQTQLKLVCDNTAGSLEELAARLERQEMARRTALEKLQSANALSDADKKRHRSVIRFLEESRRGLRGGAQEYGETADAQQSARSGEEYVRAKYREVLEGLKAETGRVQAELHALFAFAEQAFEGKDGSGGNEMLILVTELTVNRAGAWFIASFGSEDYKGHSEELMLGERGDALKEQIAQLRL